MLSQFKNVHLNLVNGIKCLWIISKHHHALVLGLELGSNFGELSEIVWLVCESPEEIQVWKSRWLCALTQNFFWRVKIVPHSICTWLTVESFLAGLTMEQLLGNLLALGASQALLQ